MPLLALLQNNFALISIKHYAKFAECIIKLNISAFKIIQRCLCMPFVMPLWLGGGQGFSFTLVFCLNFIL